MNQITATTTGEMLVMPTPQLQVLEARFNALRDAREAVAGPDPLATYARINDMALDAQAQLYSAFAEHMRLTREQQQAAA